MAEKRNISLEDTSAREIVLTRVFDAPREVVWNAWTDPEQVVQWWGPRGFTITIHEMDVRPGGVWRHTMHGPAGTDYFNKSTFIEVVKPERIVYSNSGGKKGDSGAQFEATWIFEAQGDKTKLTLRMVFPSASAREHVVQTYGAIEGGKQTLDRLAEQLAKISAASNELVITRMFDAPRSLVFTAWTDPKQVAQWWGPKGFTNPVCELDARPGGTILIHMRGPDGRVYPMTGVYQDVVEPERIVFTSAPLDEKGIPLFELLTTVILEEQGGKTKQTVTVRVIKRGPDAAQYLAGMGVGWTQTLERLAEYVAKG
ncbi:MAG TPA: SRPBCC domain-containing protein [Candidatus Acidoferrum sp.]